MAYKDTILADSPILYVTFDEAGSTVADSSTAARTVTAAGGPVKATGIAGTAMVFDGVNDTVSAASVADHTGGNLTWEVWFKTSQNPGTGTFIRRDGNGAAYLLRINSGKVEWYANNGAMAISPTVKADGQWHHAVGVKSASAITLYIDGVSVATGSATNVNTGSAAALYLGSAGGSSEWFNGTLDEVAIYNTALSAARIQAHYNAKPTPNSVNQAPAMTINVTAPVVKSRLGRTITVTPMVASVSMPDPKASALQHRYITQDRGRLNGTADSAAEMLYLRPNEALMQFALPDIGAGYALEQAILRIKPGGQPNTFASLVTEAWSEITSNAPAVEAGTEIQAQNLFTSTAINITAFVKRWMGGTPNNGIALSNGTDSSPFVYARDTTAPQNTPYVEYTLKVAVPEPVVVSAPAMTVSLAMPQHRSGVGTTTTVSAGSASVMMPAPVVKTVKSPKIQVKAMTVTVQMPGGEARNPHFTATVTPMETWLYAQPVRQFVGYPRTVTVDGTMNVSVAMNDATVNLRTDRRIFVTNSMGVSAKMVGIYSKESDRYFTYVPSTVDADDVWLPLDEISGTIAHDIVGTTEGGQQPDLNHGEYVGNPELNVTGAYLRKAVRFDGIDDHLKINYKPYVSYFAPTADTTIEFSLKTTQLNGVLMTGNNVGVYGEVPGYMTDQAEIRLVNGELALYTGAAGGRLTYPVRKFVADGQWHHIILAIPATDAPQANQNATRPHFVAVDGKVVWQRYQAALTGRMAPSAFMARVEAANYAPVVSQVVAGELSNIIVRTNSAISPMTAQKLYYEWSETLLIKAAPMVVSVSMNDPAKARGNAKRMIALYGLPFHLGDAWPTQQDEYFNYYSIFAGYYVDTMYSELSPNAHKGLTYHQVRPFSIEDYMVYPVAITGGMFGSGNVASAPGMEKEGVRDPYTGQFIDDETGLSRFIDLDKDLAEPIENFDAITVVNYPTATPETGGFLGGGSADIYREPRQSAYALTIPQWQAARDRLRDSILSAAYKGVNLWVNEPWMAEHLGIIQGWDKHAPSSNPYVSPVQTQPRATNMDEFTFAQYSNDRARELDLAHKGTDWISNDLDLAPVADPLLGRYKWTFQINSKRRIVSTEPGLTSLPSFERGDRIDYRSRDRFKPHADWTAYDLMDKMGGLSIGDKIGMDMLLEGNSAMGPWWSSGNPRRFIVSAKPQGIVGKVISREDTHYYGPNGVVVDNPYKDNAFTIAVERGTSLRGQPIKGRIFVEFMSPDTESFQLPVDRTKNKWKGDLPGQTTGKNVTTWDFDSRRYRQSAGFVTNEGASTRGTNTRFFRYDTRYTVSETADLSYKPYLSMNSRGLSWLSVENNLAPGEVRAYVPAMEVDVTTPAPKATQDRSAVVTVSAMRVDVELRQPLNFRSNNVSEKTTPMMIDVSLQGLGKAIKATPMEITVTAGANARAFGDGDRIYVYLDGQNEVTLFMKED